MARYRRISHIECEELSRTLAVGSSLRVIEGVDLREIFHRSRDQSEFKVPLLLPIRPMADQFLCEVDVLASDVNRNYLPGLKKGGGASFYALLNQAPAILSLPVFCSRYLGGVARERGERLRL